MQCTSHTSATSAKLPQGAESDLLLHLPWQHSWHLHCLHVIIDQFREHNLKLKPSKCSYFRKEITYLAYEVSKDGVQPSNSNIEVIAECVLPQTYTDLHVFLSLVGHYMRFIKWFACIAQPLSKYLTGEGASRILEWVLLTEDALKAFKALKQACMTTPILVFADYTKPFLLVTDVSKDGLGALLLQRQADRWYHPITYGSKALRPHEKNYHSTKLKFLALKWAVMEHSKEYLPYQSFLVRTDNNLLTYIMSTPNLDAMGHQWVSALAWFNWNTRKDVITQWQMHLAELLLDWTQTQWDQSSIESHWEQCIGLKFMTLL